MTENKITKRRALLIGLPVTAALLLGGVGVAYAADSGSSASPNPSATSDSEQADSSQHDTSDAKPSYTSSVTTTATEDSGSEASADKALAGLAKIDLAAAAKAGEGAVSGSTAVGVELGNESGNVVYTVEVVTATEKTEVVIDAGNASVLAKTVEHDDAK